MNCIEHLARLRRLSGSRLAMTRVLPCKRSFTVAVAGSLVLAVGLLVNYYRSASRHIPTPSPIAGIKYRIDWQPPRPFRSEGIEWAERINEQLMRRRGEEFKKAISGARSELP